MARQKEESVNYEKFKGINNQKSIHELTPEELAEALNVDFTDDGKFRRRVGFSSVYAGDCRSLYAGELGDIALFMQGGILNRFNSDYTSTALQSGFSSTKRMSYCEVNGNVYFSNGVDSGVIDSITPTSANVRSWGIDPPTALPVLAVTTGSLYSGVYSVVTSFIAFDGRESATSLESTITLIDGQGIALSGIQSHSEAEFVQIYVTDSQGKTYYRTLKVSNGTTTATITGAEIKGTAAGVNLFKSPMPFGTMIAFHYGRIYVVDGNIIWYSEPYNFEICDKRFNFFQMDGDVTMIAPVKEGIFIADKKTHFMRFKADPKTAILEKKFNYSAIPHTVAYADGEFVGENDTGVGQVIWNSPEGIILGDDSGATRNLSGRYIMKGESIEGASMFRQKNGLNQYVSIEKQTGGAESNLAVSDQIGMEIRRGVL